MNAASPTDYSDASFLKDRQAVVTLLQSKDAEPLVLQAQGVPSQCFVCNEGRAFKTVQAQYYNALRTPEFIGYCMEKAAL